jgi:hypothetical protein
LAPASLPALRLLWTCPTSCLKVGEDPAGGLVVGVVEEDVVVVLSGFLVVVVVAGTVVDEVVEVVEVVVVGAAAVVGAVAAVVVGAVVVDATVVEDEADDDPGWRWAIRMPAATAAMTTKTTAATIAVRRGVNLWPRWPRCADGAHQR